MTDHLTEDEVLDAIPTLTRSRLACFIEMELLQSVSRDAGVVRLFRRVDFARLQLLCELTDGLDLDENAVGVVIALIDQLHATRLDLLALARAVGAEPTEVRARIGSVLLRNRP